MDSIKLKQRAANYRRYCLLARLGDHDTSEMHSGNFECHGEEAVRLRAITATRDSSNCPSRTRLGSISAVHRHLWAVD